jgi:hypothetical protein
MPSDNSSSPDLGLKKRSDAGGSVAVFVILGVVAGLVLIGAAGWSVSRNVRRRRLLQDLKDQDDDLQLTYQRHSATGERQWVAGTSNQHRRQSATGASEHNKRHSAAGMSRIDNLKGAPGKRPSAAGSRIDNLRGNSNKRDISRRESATDLMSSQV